MEEIKLKKDDLFSEIRKISNKDYLYISVIGWSDMDYFKELCEENGGCDEEVLSIYKNLPLSKKVFLKDFPKILNKYIKYPILQSNNGEVKFYYDLHMWVNGYYMVYNFDLERLIKKKVNVFERILGYTLVPSWQVQ